MILQIDASNITAGGGIIHLQNLLRVAKPFNYGFKHVIVYGGEITLETLSRKEWLDLREISILNKSVFKRISWQYSTLDKYVKSESSLLLVLGGFYLGKIKPFVTTFQNMQVFESKELNREFFSKEWLRLHTLQRLQSNTFKKSNGLICLSKYSHNYLIKFYPSILRNTVVKTIPHGVNISINKNINKSTKKPYLVKNILFVSTIKNYKHQWNLIDSIGFLRKQGLLLQLHLVGGGKGTAYRRISDAIARNSEYGEFVYLHGNLSFNETLKWYRRADIFVFPSSCETFGISLLEAMAASLPIACSDRGPMPEILKDGGLYFNPESTVSITSCIRKLINNPSLRTTLSKRAIDYASEYTWERCADDTFAFLQSVYKNSIT